MKFTNTLLKFSIKQYYKILIKEMNSIIRNENNRNI
jgi:hypothetical protein